MIYKILESQLISIHKKLNENNEWSGNHMVDADVNYNHPEPIRRGIKPSNADIAVIAMDDEFALLKTKLNELYIYYYTHDDTVLEPYADEYAGADYEYSEDVISNYINDNIGKLKICSGINNFGNTDCDLYKVDVELANMFVSEWGDQKTICDKLKAEFSI